MRQTFRSILTPLGLATGLMLSAESASAQRPRPEPSRSNLAPRINKHVQVMALNLPCADIAIPSNAQSQPKRKRSLGDRIGQAVKEAAIGDARQLQTARGAIGVRAEQVVRNSAATIVVVIGADSDLETVAQSLVDVDRPITIAFTDIELEDENTCNPALSAGLAGQRGLDAGRNIMVLLPAAAGETRIKRTLSTMVISPSIWDTVFAIDGDDSALERLIAGTRRN